MKFIGWYSPHSHHWSKSHIQANYDWLCSDPPVTLCGRKPARQHRQFQSIISNTVMPNRVCNQCRKEFERDNQRVETQDQMDSVMRRLLNTIRRMLSRICNTVVRRNPQIVGV